MQHRTNRLCVYATPYQQAVHLYARRVTVRVCICVGLCSSNTWDHSKNNHLNRLFTIRLLFVHVRKLNENLNGFYRLKRLNMEMVGAL
jgi:hypothetical protein